MQTVPSQEVQLFAARALEAMGLMPYDAEVTASCLTYANLRGVDSHGVMRLVQYAETVRRGDVNVRPVVEVVSRQGIHALIDAGGGYGFAPTLMAVELAVELSHNNGLGLVGVRNSHHFGMAATYAERAAMLGTIGIVATNTGPVMAPFGGSKPAVGNNPIAFGVPRSPPHPPLVLDMALSQTAFGRIRLAAFENRPIPLGWAYDLEGRPTTHAKEALEAGLLAPIGGYKGYGLALIVDILTGILTGSRYGPQADSFQYQEGGVGHLVIAVRPDVFTSEEWFFSSVETLIHETKSIPLAAGVDTIYMPGEIERELLSHRQSEGVPISDELSQHLNGLARKLGISPPAWLSSADDGGS